MIPGETISLENLDNLVKQHMAFLIRTVSNFTGRYVSIENDEEFSIALLAFTEAVKRYDKEKGTFLTFAKLVIEKQAENLFDEQEKGWERSFPGGYAGRGYGLYRREKRRRPSKPP